MTRLCDTCAKDCKMPGNILTCTSYDKRDEIQPVDYEKPGKASIKAEDELQANVHGWLHLRGYYDRTTADIMCIHKAPRGFQIHLQKPKGNPILLDILLLGNDGRYLEMELKSPPIRWAGPEQRTLCQQYGLPVFTTLEGVKRYVEKWEEQK